MVTVEFSPSMMASGKLGQKVTASPQGETVRELLEALGVDLREVGMVLINQEAANLASSYQAGDHIYVLPMLCGG